MVGTGQFSISIISPDQNPNLNIMNPDPAHEGFTEQ
jgi:hypothetical protein